jgi:TRAP-type C4-dicarboxylate transport system permease small subunit
VSEGSFLLGDLAPGRGFVLALLAVLTLALIARVAISRRMEDRFVQITGALERWVLTGLLLLLVGLSAFQIVFRNVFGSGFVWIDPFLRSLVLWLTFLGAFAATAQGRHIAIDVVGRLLPERPRAVLARALSAIAGAVCVALSNGAYEYVSLERGFEADAFLGIPTWQVQIILLVGFVLLAYRFFLATVLGVKATHGGPVGLDGDAAYGGHSASDGGRSIIGPGPGAPAP